jgi:hypothetical protein
MARKNKEVESWYMPAQDVECPLCTRLIPPAQQDKHHLIPKLKGGTETQVLHRICHRQLHALFTEPELAQKYNTVEALLTHPEVVKFVAWVRSKPPEFYESSKRSNARR